MPTPGRLKLILGVSCLSMFITALDNSIVNLALPALHQDLHSSVSTLQWTVDAYTLVLSALLLTAGASADRFGRKRTFLVGLALFTLASLLCGLAPTAGWLIGFRALQAVGGSMLNPVAMSIISTAFPEPAARAKAFGVWSSVYGASMAAGPLVGGVLVGTVGWRSIFFVNVPVGIIAILLTLRVIPESRAERPRRPDPVGQALVIVILAPLIYALIEGPSAGWTSVQTLSLIGVAVLAGIALPLYERRRREPLIDMSFLRSVPFTGATLLAVSAFIALGGFLFTTTIYLQQVRDYSALRAGLYLLPMALMTLLFAPVAGQLAASRGTRLPLLIAGSATLASGLLLTQLGPHTNDVLLLGAFTLFGLGFSMVNAPITSTAVSGMPRSQAAVASAIASTSRFVGQSLGVAIIGSVVSSQTHGPIATGFAQASHAGWWIIAGCGLVILILGTVTTTAWAGRTALRVAARLSEEHPAASLTEPAGPADAVPGPAESGAVNELGAATTTTTTTTVRGT